MYSSSSSGRVVVVDVLIVDHNMGRLNLLSILSLLLFVTPAWTESAKMNVSSVTFTKLEKFLSTSNEVFHMELDLNKNNGSILFSAWSHLWETDGETTSILTTISRLYLTNFQQLNSTHVALVNYNRHCITVLNRGDNQVETLAGTCDSEGYVDGRVGTGKLNYPRSIEVDIRNPSRLLVTDLFNHALRYVDLQTGELGTVINSGLSHPVGMLWANHKLLITNNHFISEISWLNDGTAISTVVTGSNTSGVADGRFEDARFFSPSELVEVGEDLYLVADYNNQRLRLLNMWTDSVGPVCIDGESRCMTRSQVRSKPRSFLRVGSDLYLGMDRDIYKLSGSNIPTKAVDRLDDPDQCKENVAGDTKLDCRNTAVAHKSGLVLWAVLLCNLVGKN